MKHRLPTSQRPPEGLRCQQIPFLPLARNAFQIAKVTSSADQEAQISSLPCQRTRHMTAQEAGGTRNKSLHARLRIGYACPLLFPVRSCSAAITLPYVVRANSGK